MYKTRSKDLMLLTHWLLRERPCVQGGHVMIVSENNKRLRLEIFQKIKIRGQGGHIGRFFEALIILPWTETL
ncbi:MAG: hypothetical protein COT84_07570 [Chlamydiae bacterium CG10_big_fil_rev_8_21_14_0_10_35_9]|nr:MAG: hypothetical protein COT84_07570 [Chlamydiae bacterium CG10_big_fil_rev_8_21_14_0_10_35_9]